MEKLESCCRYDDVISYLTKDNQSWIRLKLVDVLNFVQLDREFSNYIADVLMAWLNYKILNDKDFIAFLEITDISNSFNNDYIEAFIRVFKTYIRKYRILRDDYSKSMLKIIMKYWNSIYIQDSTWFTSDPEIPADNQLDISWFINSLRLQVIKSYMIYKNNVLKNIIIGKSNDGSWMVVYDKNINFGWVIMSSIDSFIDSFEYISLSNDRWKGFYSNLAWESIWKRRGNTDLYSDSDSNATYMDYDIFSLKILKKFDCMDWRFFLVIKKRKDWVPVSWLMDINKWKILWLITNSKRIEHKKIWLYDFIFLWNKRAKTVTTILLPNMERYTLIIGEEQIIYDKYIAKSIVESLNFHSILEIWDIAKKAWEEIMQIYNQEWWFDINDKESDSSVKIADKKSYDLITESLLHMFPGIPILSEEWEIPSYDVRKKLSLFWMIDSLDWTKGFISKNWEFTINISLIHNNKPVVWVVHSPINWVTYVAKEWEWAYKIFNWEPEQIYVNRSYFRKLVMVWSRSNNRELETKFIEWLNEFSDNIETIYMWSSLKICQIAEWKAHIYPKFTRCMEWDIVAWYIILKEAWGDFIYISDNWDMYFDMGFNKPYLDSPSFMAGTSLLLNKIYWFYSESTLKETFEIKI